MICHAVIDTNVLVSALLSNHADAATVQIVGRLISGEIVPNPRATFAVLDCAGHNLQIEQPALFDCLVREWIMRVET